MNPNATGGLLALVVLAGCAGCGGADRADPSSPAGVVQTFYEHLGTGSYDDAKALYGREARTLVTEPGAAEGFRTWAEQETHRGSIREIEILETTADDRTATVRFEIRYDDGTSVERRVSLVREDGAWKLGLIA